MLSKNIEGYIVVDNKGALELCFDKHLPKSGILFHGNAVTIFNCYSTAYRTSKRSLHYAKSKGYEWGDDEQYITKVVRHGK